jgi:hypothetical protein
LEVAREGEGYCWYETDNSIGKLGQRVEEEICILESFNVMLLEAM